MNDIVIATKKEINKVANWMYSIYTQVTSQVHSLRAGPFNSAGNFILKTDGEVLGGLYPFAGFTLTPLGSTASFSGLHSLRVSSVDNPIANAANVFVQLQKRDVATVSGQQVQLSTTSNPASGSFSSQGIFLNTTAD